MPRFERMLGRFGVTLMRQFLTYSEINAGGEIIEVCATIFALKEAIAKALGVGFNCIHESGISPLEILILFDEKERLYRIKLSDRAQLIASSLGIRYWHISFSSNKQYVLAIAIGS